jgi:hypothetical protein
VLAINNGAVLLRAWASHLMPFIFCFLRAGGAKGAIARRWSVAPLALISFMLSLTRMPAGASHIITLQSWSAASQRFTPGYCSFGAFGAKKQMALGVPAKAHLQQILIHAATGTRGNRKISMDPNVPFLAGG